MTQFSDELAAKASVPRPAHLSSCAALVSLANACTCGAGGTAAEAETRAQNNYADALKTLQGIENENLCLRLEGMRPGNSYLSMPDIMREAARRLRFRDELVAMLRELEWSASVLDDRGESFISGCPICEATEQSQAHTTGCHLVALLAKAGAQ